MELQKDVKDDRNTKLLLDNLMKKDAALKNKLHDVNISLISWSGILSVVIILNIYTMSTFKKSWTILGLLLAVPCVVKISVYKYLQTEMKSVIAKGSATKDKTIDYLSKKE